MKNYKIMLSGMASRNVKLAQSKPELPNSDFIELRFDSSLSVHKTDAGSDQDERNQ